MTAMLLLALLALAMGPNAATAKPYGKNGVVFACYKAKGKQKGSLRVVPNPKRCKKMGGWRPMSWSATGEFGQAGPAGQQGQTGSPGQSGSQGEPGKQGIAGTVEQSLLDTIEDQALQIQVLTGQVDDLTGELTGLEGVVSGLTGDVTDVEGTVSGLSGSLSTLSGNFGDLSGDLTDLEGTVADTCAQLTAVTDQADEILNGVAGVSLTGALALVGGLVQFPLLPEDPLGEFEC